jgi:hypothetical protein
MLTYADVCYAVMKQVKAVEPMLAKKLEVL